MDRMSSFHWTRASTVPTFAGMTSDRSTRLLESFRTAVRELRQALRRLLRSPWHTAAAVVTLALGIGANAAIFTVFNAVFLRPLPYRDPEGLYILNSIREATGPGGKPQPFVVAALDLVTWREECRKLQEVSGLSLMDVSLGVGDHPESVPALGATASLFTLLGVPPQIGRVFTAEEDRPGNAVVVLAHSLWQSRFGGDPSVLGRTVVVDGQARVVLGVMPKGFLPLLYRGELFVPLALDRDAVLASPRKGARTFPAAARLGPGASLAEARAEMDRLAKRLANDYPDSHRGWGARPERAREALLGDRRPALRLLLVAAFLVLLIACTNVANLLLARAAGRSSDTAVRIALGAGPTAILRPHLAECLLLCVAGTSIGVASALVLLGPLLALDPDTARLVGTPRLDGRLLVFAAALCLVATFGFGLAPFLKQLSTGALGSLRQGSRLLGSVRDRRLRQILVTTQVAISLLLLSGAGLLLRSLFNLERQDPGFDPKGLLTAQIVLPASRYAEPRVRVTFVESLVSRLRALPGAALVSTSMTRFKTGVSMQSPIRIEGTDLLPGEGETAHIRRITPGYFETMRVRLRGRDFDDRDHATALPVTIVSESFVRRHWSGVDPIGKRLARAGTWLTVVGIAADVRDAGLGSDLGPALYLPYSQNNSAGVSWAPVTLLLRTQSDPLLLTKPVREAVAALDSNLAVDALTPVATLLIESQAPQKFRTLLLLLLALVGLALSAVGIYGVTSYGAALRTREMGVRMALGAEARQVQSLIVFETLRPVLLGLGLGLVASRFVSTLVTGLLHGVSAADPAVLLGVSAILLGTALLAGLIPARRSMRLDPVRALRDA